MYNYLHVPWYKELYIKFVHKIDIINFWRHSYYVRMNEEHWEATEIRKFRDHFSKTKNI